MVNFLHTVFIKYYRGGEKIVLFFEFLQNDFSNWFFSLFFGIISFRKGRIIILSVSINPQMIFSNQRIVYIFSIIIHSGGFLLKISAEEPPVAFKPPRLCVFFLITQCNYRAVTNKNHVQSSQGGITVQMSYHMQHTWSDHESNEISLQLTRRQISC